MTTTLLDTAKKYHRWGANITAVSAKRPVHPWEQWQTTRQKPQDVARLAMWDRIGALGAISGVNGWRVIDIDHCADENAVTLFLRALGLPSRYQWTVKTGSGNGWHVWFRCDESIPPGRLSAKSSKAPGVFWFYPKAGAGFEFDHAELRWANHQTLLPPSRHPTGPGYEWFFGEPTEAPEIVALEVLLVALEKFGVNRRQVDKVQPPTPAPPPAFGDHSPNYLNGTVNDIKRRLDIVATGQRLFAGELQNEPGDEIRILGHGGLLFKPDSQVFYNFRDEAGGDVLDLYGLAEYDTRWNRNDPQMFKAVLAQAAQDAGVVLPPVGGNGNLPQAATQPEQDTGPIFERLTASELLQRPPKSWLIDKLIGAMDLITAFGEAGSGKTFVALDILAAAALGRSVAGQFATPRPLRVAYCAGEGLAGLPGRVAALLYKYQVMPDQLRIDFFTDVPQLFDESAEKNIYAFVQQLSEQNEQFDLVVLDTLHAASVGADENHSRDMGVVLQAMKYTRKMLGCSVMVVHHANRAGGYRGSSALHGAMDAMLQTKADAEGYGTLECFKQKDAEAFAPLYFRLKGEPVSQSAYVEWVEKSVIKLNEPSKVDQAKESITTLLIDTPGLNQSEIDNALPDVGRHSVRAALNELEQAGIIRTEKKGRAICYQLV